MADPVAVDVEDAVDECEDDPELDAVPDGVAVAVCVAVLVEVPDDELELVLLGERELVAEGVAVDDADDVCVRVADADGELEPELDAVAVDVDDAVDE